MTPLIALGIARLGSSASLYSDSNQFREAGRR